MIKKVEKEIKEQYVEIGAQLSHKTEKVETEAVIESLKVYALY